MSVDLLEGEPPLRRRHKDCHLLPFQTAVGKLSVIIPTFNEEMNLQRALDAVGLPSYSLEVIVVDAGSSDHTIEIAQRHGCKVFVGNPGRANQMNAAAAGAHLLFLHADTRLPTDYCFEVDRVGGLGSWYVV